MAKSVRVTNERLEELTRILHFKALKVLMLKMPETVPPERIESHNGRIDKAIRVLMHHKLMYKCAPVDMPTNIPNYYGPRTVMGYWPSTLYDCVEDYAAEHNPSSFEDAVREDLEKLYENFHRNKMGIKWAGWKSIDKSNLPQLAHMFVNREKYLFMGNTGDRWHTNPSGDPLPWDKVKHPTYYATVEGVASHEKIVLRNIAEIYANKHFHKLTQGDTGLPGASDDYSLQATISNLGYVAPSEDNLGRLDKACREAVNALLGYRKGCQCLMQAVRSHGGEKAYREEVVRRAVRDMIDTAPITLVEASETGGNVEWERSPRMFAKYLMDHIDGHSFESLYDDRSPVLKVKGESEGIYGKIRDPLNNTFRKVLGMKNKE